MYSWQYFHMHLPHLKYNHYCNQDVIEVCFMFHTLLNMTTGKNLSLVSFAILQQILVKFGMLAEVRNMVLLSKVCGV